MADVRSFSQPLGSAGKAGLTRLALLAAGRKVAAAYLGRAGSARLTVVLSAPPLSNAAMSTLRRIRQTARSALPEGFRADITGATAEMADVRAVTSRDFLRVAGLALGAIFLIVLALLRDAVLSAFMVASTVLSYLATLGLTWAFFVLGCGQSGLDWKVEVFLFVVMVAVGQDYNIFLAARLAEEGRRAPPRRAAREAIIKTGGIISSAGLIMAATLGSLAAGATGLRLRPGYAAGYLRGAPAAAAGVRGVDRTDGKTAGTWGHPRGASSGRRPAPARRLTPLECAGGRSRTQPPCATRLRAQMRRAFPGRDGFLEVSLSPLPPGPDRSDGAPACALARAGRVGKGKYGGGARPLRGAAKALEK